MSVADDATASAIAAQIFRLLGALDPGSWQEDRWDDMSSSMQGAVVACNKAKLLHLETAGGVDDFEVRVKLSAAGEKLRFNPDLVEQAIMESAQWEMWNVRQWIKPIAEMTANNVDLSNQPIDAEGKATKKSRGSTVDERMQLELRSDIHGVVGFTVDEWAARLGCGRSTVADTPTWKKLQLLRASERAQRQLDRHGRNLSRQTPSGPDKTGK